MITGSHNQFIQYMLKKAIISKRKALPIITQLNVEDITDDTGLKLFLSKINKKISRHFFKIACVTCEVTGEEFLIWLNTKNDIAAKHQSTFTPAELEYFQVIMGEIINSNEKYIPFNICLNLSSTLVANLMFKTQAQTVVKKWIKFGYLVNVNGKIYFGPRCIHEFSSYFRGFEDNIRTCCLCSEAVFVGNTCESCDNLFHSVCLNTFLKRKKNCPNCKRQWTNTEDNDVP